MKIGVIGGAGVRVPLLVRGLGGSDLPPSEIALYDPDQDRLAVISRLAARLAGSVPVRSCVSSAECIEGADFVFTSIRVGGIEGRARHEAAALDHGVVGQETVGPGGFAMAMATIPHMVRYAQEVAARAPHAWIINFTNPVGIITQAVSTETGAKVVGICDTPTELFEEVAHELGLPSAECHFDYFGLNHLGWLREVYHDGEAQLHRIWENPERLARLYRAPLFEADFLVRLRLLPTEYLYYYYRPQQAFESFRRAGQSRGAVIQGLNAQLFEDLRKPAADVVRVYEAYLATRNAGYMQIESGSPVGLAPSPQASLTGYDKIALAVVRAIHLNLGTVIPLNVPNRGNLLDLEHDDVVEVPCVTNANGALPLHVGPVPEAVRGLLLQVKDYERLTVRAAVTGSAELKREALARNPLVGGRELAERLISALPLA